MKEYHVVFVGFNGFQKEEELQFPQDMPPITLHRREYEHLRSLDVAAEPFFRIPSSQQMYVRDRSFRQRAQFYALGKNIVYYAEE